MNKMSHLVAALAATTLGAAMAMGVMAETGNDHGDGDGRRRSTPFRLAPGKTCRSSGANFCGRTIL